MQVNFAGAVLTGIKSSCKELGVGIPPSLARVLQASEDAQKRLDALPTADDVCEAAQAALDAGEDPKADPATLAALAGFQLRNAFGDTATETIRTRQAKAAIAAFDEWVDAVTPAFADAAAALDAAHNELGSMSLTDSDAILRKGPKAAAEWAAAIQATNTINLINRTWGSFARARQNSADTRVLGLAVVELDHDQFVEHPMTQGETVPWDLLREGWRLHLNTYADVLRFQAEATARRRQEEDANEKKGWGRG